MTETIFAVAEQNDESDVFSASKGPSRLKDRRTARAALAGPGCGIRARRDGKAGDDGEERD